MPTRSNYEAASTPHSLPTMSSTSDAPTDTLQSMPSTSTNTSGMPPYKSTTLQMHIPLSTINDLFGQLTVDIPMSETVGPINTHNMITRHCLQQDPSLTSQMMLLANTEQLAEPKTLKTTLKDKRWV